MTAERVQKILSRAGIASRRHAEEMIREGRVTVDGRVPELGERVDPALVSLKVDGKRIRPPADPKHYLLLHKPPGHVSTVSDPEGRPTVLDLVPQRFRKGLRPVGRLDFDSEGLILLTDDGELAHRVSHPRYGCTKTYEVKVRGRPVREALDKLRRGMVLDGRRTSPARIEPRHHQGGRPSETNSWWRVVLREGRNRQIREMFQRIGHPVVRLRRIAIGPVVDRRLPRGEWRPLATTEIDSLRRRTATTKKKTRKTTKKPGAPASSTPKSALGRRRGPSRPSKKKGGRRG